MPETFLKDQSVPARWRVLGIVNGFAINGLDCYASNAWFMEQLGCTSEQTVSNAVEELEKLGEITCDRTRRSRVMRRTFRDPNDLGSRPQPVGVSDPNQLGTNSPSNSPNGILLKEISEKEDSPERETYAQIRGYATNRVKSIRARGEEIVGSKFPNQLAQEKQIANCLRAGFSEEKILSTFEELLEDEFWGSRGVDFTTVASQIGKAKRERPVIKSYGKSK